MIVTAAKKDEYEVTRVDPTRADAKSKAEGDLAPSLVKTLTFEDQLKKTIFRNTTLDNLAVPQNSKGPMYDDARWPITTAFHVDKGEGTKVKNIAFRMWLTFDAKREMSARVYAYIINPRIEADFANPKIMTTLNEICEKLKTRGMSLNDAVVKPREITKVETILDFNGNQTAQNAIAVEARCLSNGNGNGRKKSTTN
jgi:hypothetical protein